MVQSILNPSLNYTENRNIDNNDINYDASVYKVKLYSIQINIAIGQINNIYQERYNIVYFPIYLISNKKVILQIGIYEFLSNELFNKLDTYGNIMIDYMYNPLIYSFIDTNKQLLSNTYNDILISEEKILKVKEDTADILSKQSSKLENESKIQKEVSDKLLESVSQERKENNTNAADLSIKKDTEDEKDTQDEKGSEDDEKDTLQLFLNEQTKEEALKENKEFNLNDDTTWIESYLKNNNYKIKDNEGGGDCLFATIRDAYNIRGDSITVQDIRTKLSEDLTGEPGEKIFQNHKEQYLMYKNELIENKKMQQQLANENKTLKIKLDAATDKNEKLTIFQTSKIIKKDFEKLKQDKQMTEMLFNEFKFMKNIDNLTEFKEIVKTCDFWANDWAIGTLERILQIKFIIFSSEYYKNNDKNNVLLCGHLSDRILSDTQEFTPKFYIMIEYTGDHYKLILYKNRATFTFNELPYQVKQLIVNKCFERLGGPFSIINDFKEYNQNLKIPLETHLAGNIEEIDIETNSLYDDNTIFLIYDKSFDKLPGKGVGEYISNKNIKIYANLTKYNDWRKKLDNLWDGNILEIDGKKWKSVEHYLQANKFLKNNKDFYDLFSLDSNSKISQDVKLAIKAGSDDPIYKGETLRSKNIKIDKNFHINKNKLLEKALFNKFNNNDELRDILINTKKSKLMRYIKSNPPILLTELMKIRKILI